MKKEDIFRLLQVFYGYILMAMIYLGVSSSRRLACLNRN